MGIRITSRVKQWESSSMDNLEFALASLSTEIHRIAIMNAPHLNGALQDSGKVERLESMKYQVRFGDSEVPYALRRHYENKKNPQTLRYLERAAESVFTDISEYFKGIFK